MRILMMDQVRVIRLPAHVIAHLDTLVVRISLAPRGRKISMIKMLPVDDAVVSSVQMWEGTSVHPEGSGSLGVINDSRRHHAV